MFHHELIPKAIVIISWFTHVVFLFKLNNSSDFISFRLFLQSTHKYTIVLRRSRHSCYMHLSSSLHSPPSEVKKLLCLYNPCFFSEYIISDLRAGITRELRA